MKNVFFAAALAVTSMAATAADQMNLVGAATMIGSDIQLVSQGNSAGAAWIVAPVSTTDSFSIDFAFSLQNNGYSPMADGITFALQSQGTNALGSAGGDVGYGGLDAVGSVIQTWSNNKAGLNIDGNPYNTQAAPANLGFANLVTGTENVQYDASTNVLSMTGTLNVDDSIYNISDSRSIDLSAKFGSTMTMGFTGATGGSYADQRITSLSVNSVAAVPEPETYAMLLGGLGALGFVARRRKSQ